jgi:ATP-dependent protease ClpP protease subunit
VNLIVIDGAINPAADDFIRESVAGSAREGAEALLIELDTPGGLLSSAKSIVKEILGAPLPVIVYVAPTGASATSAGMFVTLAAHVAAMAPGTTIGAAHPVDSSGGDIGHDMCVKIENLPQPRRLPSSAAATSRGRSAPRESVAAIDRGAKTDRRSVALDVPALLASLAGREVCRECRVTPRLGAAIEVVRREMRLKTWLNACRPEPGLLKVGFWALRGDHASRRVPSGLWRHLLLLALAARAAGELTVAALRRGADRRGARAASACRRGGVVARARLAAALRHARLDDRRRSFAHRTAVVLASGYAGDRLSGSRTAVPGAHARGARRSASYAARGGPRFRPRKGTPWPTDRCVTAIGRPRVSSRGCLAGGGPPATKEEMTMLEFDP